MTKAEKLVELYEKLHRENPDNMPTTKEMARQVDCTPEYARAEFRRRGIVQKRGRPRDVARLSTVKMLTEKGFTREEIAEVMQITVNHVAQKQRMLDVQSPNDPAVKMQRDFVAAQILEYERHAFQQRLDKPWNVRSAEIIEALRVPRNQVYKLRTEHPKLLHKMLGSPTGKKDGIGLFHGIQCHPLEPNGIKIPLPAILEKEKLESVYKFFNEEPWFWGYDINTVYPGIDEPGCTLEVFWHKSAQRETFVHPRINQTVVGYSYYADHGLYCTHSQCEFLMPYDPATAQAFADQTCKAHAADCDCSLGDCLN